MNKTRYHFFSSRRVAWGIAFVSVWLALGSVFFAWHERARDLHFENPYPLIDISRNFIPQEHFLTTIQPLREAISALVVALESEGFTVSVYLEYLNTGANISVNPQTRIFPASLTKLPLALAVMKKIERGEWRYTNELVLFEEDKNHDSGDPTNLIAAYPVGTRFTIESLLHALLVHSDNTAYLILRRNLHDDEINRVFVDLGLEDLFTEDGRMSAKEYSRIFRALYVSSFLKREYSQQILAWLDESTFARFLARDLPADIPFPHKYGENLEFNVYSDSGIVYLPNRPYLLTVMVSGVPGRSQEESETRAEQFMGDVSARAFTYFSSESQ